MEILRGKPALKKNACAGNPALKDKMTPILNAEILYCVGFGIVCNGFQFLRWILSNFSLPALKCVFLR